MPVTLTIKYLDKYKKLIKENPLLASEVENVLRWVSYLVSGRFNNSNILSELVYTSSYLLQITNDIMLRRSFNWKSNSDVVERLKISITVIEYTQVFLEISAKKLIGEAGRWILISCIQITKALLKLILLLKFNCGLQNQIPYAPLDRQRDVPVKGPSPSDNNDSVPEQSTGQLDNKTMVTLPRSKRIIRTLGSAPPRQKRTWRLPTEPIFRHSLRNGPPTTLNDNGKLAEVIYIMRPLVHLSAMKTFGVNAWTPSVMAFGMDVTSLHLLNSSDHLWNAHERAELKQRSFALFLYLMRSPFYDRYTKVRILRILRILSEKIPLFGSLLKPLIQYLPEWQKTYFYVWNS